MPGGDRTGPNGLGPMTGRAAGACAGYANPVGGRGYRGFGRGFRGGGRGRRNGYYTSGMPGWERVAQGMHAWGGYAGGVAIALNAEQEQQALKEQAEHLQQSLNNINRRIDELAKDTSE
jgi:hypothetical protein